MTTIEREITDKTKVSDLTVGDLKNIIRAVLEETLVEMKETLFFLEQALPDPDEGKKLKPEFEAELKQALSEPMRRGMGKTHEQLLQELSIDE